MKKQKRIYPGEFKLETVRLVTEQSYKVSEASRNLGIGRDILSRWISEHKNEGTDSFPGKGNMAPESEELLRLGKENKLLRQEEKF